MVDKKHKKDLSCLIILAWEVWKHCKGYVFNGDLASICVVLRSIADKAALSSTDRANQLKAAGHGLI